MAEHLITVKLVARGQTAEDAPMWLRQTPGLAGVWKSCRFVFDPEARGYDWLAVYDDLPPQQGERFSLRREQLACPPEQTIFITGEPSTIKIYGKDFLGQFGVVISSQEPWTAPPGDKTLFTLPGLRWFHGVPVDWKQKPDTLLTFDDMLANPPLAKTQAISTLCSSKAMGHTLHKKRVEFTNRLQQAFPELEVFGHGRRFINDKRDGLDPYRYHVAMENHICRHHVTEKLTDAFLGGGLPFYIGAPNAADYFPADSFIPLDPDRPDEAIAIIQQAIANDEYGKRLPAILEARRRVMEEHNIFAILERIIAARGIRTGAIPNPTPLLLSRRAMRSKTPLHALRFLGERASARLHHLRRI